MLFQKKITWLISVIIVFEEIRAADDDYNILRTDGSYDFGYDNPDSYHYAQANRNNVVRGEFGGRNPKTGGIDTTHYTAGPRGYRPRGKNIVRKYDLSQTGPRAVGSPDDPYYDPYEDPSYSFSFRTRTYNRDENANRVGDVNGRYSYIDDVGERHNVEFIAGKKTGFHVKTPFPDSNPRGYGPLYFRGRGKPIPRGRTSIQRGLDGSYKFVSAGPDQRRTETSDATGHVRGSYTYLDDKGVQHSVHYIAGPETGYRVLKNVKGPHLPSIFPFQHPDIIPPDFYDNPEIFNTAASDHGRVKPAGKPGFKDDDNGIDEDDDDFGKTRPGAGSKPSGGRPPFNRKPIRPPISPFDEGDSDDNTDFDDLFGGTGGGRDKVSSGGSRGGGTKSVSSGGSKGGGRESASTGGSKGGGGSLDDEGSRESGGGGSSGGARPISSGGSRGGGGPIVTSEEGSFGNSREDSSKDDGSYKPPKNGQNGLYIPPKPSKKPPGGFSDEDYGIPSKQSPSEEKDDYDPFSGGRLKPGSKIKPPYSGSASGEDVDFGGLFGSESNRPRPYGGSTGPVITVGGPNKNCPKCEGAIVTNIGDTYLAVPPRSSVRAHVQAIDLLPYSSRFPGPSDQYKADVSLKTEQLNAEKDEIVSKNDKNTSGGGEGKDDIASSTEKNDVDEDDESQTTEGTSTEIVPTTFSPKNTTIK